MSKILDETPELDDGYEYGVRSQSTPESKGVLTWHESRAEAEQLVGMIESFANATGITEGESYLVRRVRNDNYERVES